MYNFGKRLKQLRKGIPLSQEQLAKRLGVTKSLISSYENDVRFPSCEVLLQLSRIFHVSVDYLLGQEAYTAIRVDGLNEHQILLLVQLVDQMRRPQSDPKEGNPGSSFL